MSLSSTTAIFHLDFENEKRAIGGKPVSVYIRSRAARRYLNVIYNATRRAKMNSGLRAAISFSLSLTLWCANEYIFAKSACSGNKLRVVYVRVRVMALRAELLATFVCVFTIEFRRHTHTHVLAKESHRGARPISRQRWRKRVTLELKSPTACVRIHTYIQTYRTLLRSMYEARVNGIGG